MEKKKVFLWMVYCLWMPHYHMYDGAPDHGTK